MRSTALAVVAVLGIFAVGAPAVGAQAPPRGPWVPSWEVFLGGFQQVDSLAATGDNGAWGVDATAVSNSFGRRDQTAFVHVQGNVWRVEQLVDEARLQAIAMSGDRAGFAVGSYGRIYGFDGTQWRRVVSPSGVQLWDVALLSPTEGWAVGEQGTALRWDGAAWRATETNVRDTALTGVASVAPGEAWATWLLGPLVHFVDNAWWNELSPHLTEPVDVAFASPEHGMVVGRGALELRDGNWRVVGEIQRAYSSVAWSPDGHVAYATSSDHVLAYRDQRWSQVTFDPAPVDLARTKFARVVNGPNAVFGLSGDGTIVEFTGTSGRYLWPPVRNLLAVDLATPDFGWAGGQALSAGFIGLKDGVWGQAQALPTGSVVGDIDLVSTTDGWAVGYLPGEFREARVWRWDGTAWGTWPVDKTWVVSYLDMLGSDEGWASGFNVVIRWDGQTWRLVPNVPAGAAAGALSMLHGGENPEGWFGSVGRIFHLHNDQWDSQRLPGEGVVEALAVPAPDEGWAVTRSALYRYDGRDWTKVALPLGPESTVWDVDAPERGNAWVLVEPDGLFHWTGVGWERHDLANMGAQSQPVRLRAIRPVPGSPATDVWLVGAPPSIARYRVVRSTSMIYAPLTLRNEAGWR